jgi:hypothetical protein
MQQILCGDILDKNEATVLPLSAKPWKGIMLASLAAVPFKQVLLWSNYVIRGKI